MSFSKFDATCLAKICAIKVQEGVVEIQTVEQEIVIDNSVEEYMKEVKEAVKTSKKALIKLNTGDDKDKYYGLNLSSQNPVYEALRLTPISELDYII